MIGTNSLIFVLVAILILSIFFSNFVHRRSKEFALLAGVEFVLLGTLLSHNFGFAIILDQDLTKLTPFISVLTGLYGFLLGLDILKAQKNAASQKTGFLLFTLIICISFIFIFPFFLLFYPKVIASGELKTLSMEFYNKKFAISFDPQLLSYALCLSAISAIPSSSSLLKFAALFPSSQDLTSYLSRLALSGETIGTITAGIGLAALRAFDASAGLGLTVTEWVVVSVVAGIFCGILFWLTSSKDDLPMRIFVLTIGVITFTSGVAHLIGFSSLFLGAICGFIVGSTSKDFSHIHKEISSLNDPISLLILFFAGALVTTENIRSFWLLPAIYVSTRIFGLLIIPFFLQRTVFKGLPYPGRIFCSQDVLAVAIALDMKSKSNPFSNEFLVCITFAYCFFALLSHSVVKKSLNQLWEFRPVFGKE